MTLTSAPYEEREKGAAVDDGAPGIEPGATVDLGRAPTTETEPAYGADTVSQLLSELAGHERKVFEEALAGMHEQMLALLDQRLSGMHDPKNTMLQGVLIGVGVTLGAVIGLVLIGLLFLHGVAVVRAL